VAALTLFFRKAYPKSALIEVDLKLELHPPGVTVLFGPSGSGKTTILRALAGLERSADCLIHFGPENWVNSKSGLFVPPQRRDRKHSRQVSSARIGFFRSLLHAGIRDSQSPA